MQSQKVLLSQSGHSITIRFKVVQNCGPAQSAALGNGTVILTMGRTFN